MDVTDVTGQSQSRAMEVNHKAAASLGAVRCVSVRLDSIWFSPQSPSSSAQNTVCYTLLAVRGGGFVLSVVRRMPCVGSAGISDVVLSSAWLSPISRSAN